MVKCNGCSTRTGGMTYTDLILVGKSHTTALPTYQRDPISLTKGPYQPIKSHTTAPCANRRDLRCAFFFAKMRDGNHALNLEIKPCLESRN